MLHRTLRCVATAALCVAPSIGFAQTNEYIDRDNIEGTFIMLDAAPVRPMMITPDGDLWAVNTHDNTVERFIGAGTSPVDVYKVPWGPVSIAHWNDSLGNLEILVVSHNTWALTRIDADTGDVLGVVQLEAEPADVVVDHAADRAFVSCSGADSVLEIDLTQYGPRPTGRYHESTHPDFMIKSPYFLTLDTNGTVLVAPRHSGNNSTARGLQGTPNPSGSVLDLYDPAVAPTQVTLPDHDLFRIDPNTGPSGTVTVLARRMGTILFMHGIHPMTGDFWQLNTEANNKDPNLQSEPLVRGQFAFNQVTVVPTPFGNPTLADPSTDVISLDPGPVFTTTTTGAQPFALDFHPANGKVFIASMGSDNVVVLNPDGSFHKEWDVPAGSIPRGILVHPTGSVVLVYCFGTNKIRSYRWGNNPPNPLITFNLSHDPTPADVAAGRRVFFDARNSENKNLSCATCHVDGGTDLLAWNLSNMPKDSKGPMVTQSLIGLKRLEPFHWRGERDFDDFKGAFVGLLGNPTDIPAEDFENMRRFLFAMEQPANPFQSAERILDPNIDSITELTPEDIAAGFTTSDGDAILGQQEFRNEFTFSGRFTCNRCHAAPTGTNNDIVNDFPSIVPPERAHLDVAHFIGLHKRQQTTVDIQYLNGQGVLVDRRRAFLGVGTSHSGLIPDIFHFDLAAGSGAFLPNIAAFVHQWDQGFGKAVHFAFPLNAGTVGLATQELVTYLEPQAIARNCGIVVYGTIDQGGTPVKTRWFWDRYASTKPFKSENPAAIPARDLNDFITNAANESNVFLGVPVGMAERFGVDYDMDTIRNGLDSNPLVPGPLDITDHTGPAFVAGPAVPWQTTRAARVWFDTDEICSAEVKYWETGTTGQEQFASSSLLSRTHAVVLTGLRARTDGAGLNNEFPVEPVSYQVEVTVTDRQGNDTVTMLSPIVPQPFTDPNTNFDPMTSENDRQLLHTHIVGSLQISSFTEIVQGTVQMVVKATTAFKRGGQPPAEHRVIIARVTRTPAGTHVPEVWSDWTPIGSGLRVDEVELSAGSTSLSMPGPFLVNTALTDNNGGASFSFDVTNVSPGDVIGLNVEAVVEIRDQNLAQFATNVANVDCSPTGDCKLILPVGSNRSFTQWDFPSTQEARTCVSQQY